MKRQKSLIMPKGFRASGVASGIKDGNKLDLGLIISDYNTTCAAAFTTNQIKAAPVRLSKKNLRRSDIRAAIVNSGNANACNGKKGYEDAVLMTESIAQELNLKPWQVFTCSTGIIGYPLPIDNICSAVPDLVRKLKTNGWNRFSKSIMTSDSINKVASTQISIGKKKVTITGAAKGSGMIAPNMATMLAFVVTDVAINESDLKAVTKSAVEDSFNSISVDGDMSTNDTVMVMANGAAGNSLPKSNSNDLRKFTEALRQLMIDLAKKLVRDGEGVTKFVTLEVNGAVSVKDARKVSKAVSDSSLVKCSWNGSDPNWGRIIDAVGYSGAKVDEQKVDIFFGEYAGALGGEAAITPIGKLKKEVSKKAFTVRINLNLGTSSHRMFTSDLSEEYVAFNRLEYALKIQGH